MSRTRAKDSRRYRVRRRAAGAILGLLIVTAVAAWTAGCDSDQDAGAGADTSSMKDEGPRSGDVEGGVGEEIVVADVRITVKGLQATFRPAQPVQRLSGETPTAPGADESFYQAYVRVENHGVSPVRVDAQDFVCLFGNEVAPVEPTHSGPLARSLLKNTSLDLVLTFKWTAGYEPVLLYNPPWWDGTIRVVAPPEEGPTE